MNETPLVSVVIPTHNRAAKLRATLSALAEQDFHGSWEVIVVNNNCSDDTDALVMGTAFPVPVRLVHEPKPGAAAARNAGIRTAESEVIIFLDDDMLAPPNLLSCHLESVTKKPNLLVLGQAELPPSTRHSAFERYRRSLLTVLPRDGGLTQVRSFASGNASARRSDLLMLGGYNEAYTTAALEDADLYVRATTAGLTVVVDPRITAIHDDWAADSLLAFCERQRAYSRTAPILAANFGARNPRAEWAIRNSPPSPGAPLSERFVKRAKSLAGSRLGQRLLVAAARVAERLRLPDQSLALVYRIAIAGAMYAGYQDGLKALRAA